MEGMMQHYMNGFSGGYGIWAILGLLLAVFLVVAIVRMVQKR
jgi:uncharacterized membrane protein